MARSSAASKKQSLGGSDPRQRSLTQMLPRSTPPISSAILADLEVENVDLQKEEAADRPRKRRRIEPFPKRPALKLSTLQQIAERRDSQATKGSAFPSPPATDEQPGRLSQRSEIMEVILDPRTSPSSVSVVPTVSPSSTTPRPRTNRRLEIPSSQSPAETPQSQHRGERSPLKAISANTPGQLSSIASSPEKGFTPCTFRVSEPTERRTYERPRKIQPFKEKLRQSEIGHSLAPRSSSPDLELIRPPNTKPSRASTLEVQRPRSEQLPTLSLPQKRSSTPQPIRKPPVVRPVSPNMIPLESPPSLTKPAFRKPSISLPLPTSIHNRKYIAPRLRRPDASPESQTTRYDPYKIPRGFGDDMLQWTQEAVAAKKQAEELEHARQSTARSRTRRPSKFYVYGETQEVASSSQDDISQTQGEPIPTPVQSRQRRKVKVEPTSPAAIQVPCSSLLEQPIALAKSRTQRVRLNDIPSSPPTSPLPPPYHAYSPITTQQGTSEGGEEGGEEYTQMPTATQADWKLPSTTLDFPSSSMPRSIPSSTQDATPTRQSQILLWGTPSEEMRAEMSSTQSLDAEEAEAERQREERRREVEMSCVEIERPVTPVGKRKRVEYDFTISSSPVEGEAVVSERLRLREVPESPFC